MKKKGRLSILTACAVIVMATTFASAESDEEIVRSLICHRTDVLADFYSGEIDKDQVIDALKSSETGDLLEEDLNNIYLFFRTDVEQVKDYEITDVTITESDEKIICAEASVMWESVGLSGEEKFLCTYSVICSKENNEYKLAQFF